MESGLHSLPLMYQSLHRLTANYPQYEDDQNGDAAAAAAEAAAAAVDGDVPAPEGAQSDGSNFAFDEYLKLVLQKHMVVLVGFGNGTWVTL
jgi:hypothetical protein